MFVDEGKSFPFFGRTIGKEQSRFELIDLTRLEFGFRHLQYDFLVKSNLLSSARHLLSSTFALPLILDPVERISCLTDRHRRLVADQELEDLRLEGQ